MIVSVGGDFSRPEEPGEVVFWNATTGRMIQSRKGHKRVAWSVAFSSDGKQIASSGGDLEQGPGDIIIWDRATMQEVRSIAASRSHGIQEVAFSPDGTRLASTCNDGSVALWDTATGQPHQTLKGPEQSGGGLAFDSQGSRLVVTRQDNSLAIWDLTTDQELHSLVGHMERVIKCVFSHDGNRVLSASFDQSAKVWDAASGQELLTLRGHGGFVWSVAISRDGQRIATASEDGVVRIWDATPRVVTVETDGPKSPGNESR
jgi:WD40 repeat protein